MRTDWVGIPDSGTCNKKFDKFCSTVKLALHSVAPVKTIRISPKQRYPEPWITKGLEKSFKMKLKLYKTSLKSTHTKEDCKKYIGYRNVYNKLKRQIKTDYYQEKCLAFCDNTKKLWALINDTIKRPNIEAVSYHV